jgi:FdhE protein
VNATTFAAPTADALARERPEFRVWLDLLAVAGEEAAAQAWADAVPQASAAGAPLLSATALTIDPNVAATWLRRLLDVAAAGAPVLTGAAARLDPLAVLEAATALDTLGIDALAEAAGLPAEPLRAVLPLAAYPWLQRCGAALAGHVPADHAHAWCPICGAWATLAEARGLEGVRRLRCGRCGSDWRAEWLRCPFCGTDAHGRLRGLVGATMGDTRRADGCESCGAWVKTVTRLSAATLAEVRLLDLATVELDVAALERGWKRPSGLGSTLNVRVIARERNGGTRPRVRRRWWSR